MIGARNTDTRQRLLEAAADLIAASPGQDVPLRAICDLAGVKPPTLYHFFGSKDGLLDAVIETGFDRYLGIKSAHESTGDPIEDIRHGWDAHVAFGLDNPGFYALMYGQVAPGKSPAAQQRPTAILLGLTTAAAEHGLLAVSPEQAAGHVLAANVGVTLRQITSGAPDPELSAAMREGTIEAITRGPASRADEEGERARAARDLLRVVHREGSTLPEPETALLAHWLQRIAAS